MSLIKTTMLKTADVDPRWYVVDADAQIVGRFATQIAMVLMGKHKPDYTPHIDCGDCVVVVNVERLRFTGGQLVHKRHPYHSTKLANKIYDWFSGYPSGRRVMTGIELWERKPEEILRRSVKRMLPKNKLGRRMLDRLKLYAGPDHPHQAQQPQPFPEYLLPRRRNEE